MYLIVSNNVMQKLTNTTADKLIDDTETNNRRRLPFVINDKKGLSKKMAIKMMRTSNTKNIRFILTDIEAITTHQSVAPAPPTPLTSKISEVDLTTSSTSPKSKVKRSLNYEETSKTLHTFQTSHKNS
ncbi:unnamed protein product [Lactuca saligna]|uniref:Uncharacterized protein n=1 Tax=Lactuca saligna TaxID=75948 RepID=A0AA35UZR6_LACSI|nr:unnamed protein product [Lactuca saligna]